MPTACAAIPMRPPSSVARAIRRPAPRAPSSSPGVPSKARSAVARGVQPELLLLADGAKPGRPPAHDERAGAPAGPRVEGEDREDVGVGAVRDPLLRARHAVLVVGGVRIARRVRARLGLGQREGGELVALGERRDQRSRWSSRAVRDDRQRPRARVHRDGHAEARVGPRELLEDERVGQEARADAAERLGDADAHEAELAELGQDLAREAPLAVPRGGLRARRPRRRSAARGRGSRAARR